MGGCLIGASRRPLNFTVREQRFMRPASVLFALLAALVIPFDVLAWVYGAPFHPNGVQFVALATYCTLSLLLWNHIRTAVLIGVIVSLAGLLLFCGATYFMWAYLSAELSTVPGTINLAVTLIAPLLLNLAIAAVLGRALLSNNRWRGP